LLSAQGPHAGDLPNLFVRGDGKLEVEMHAPALSLARGSALFDADGSAIVIHEGADDHRSDPAGGAGARIACGRIETSE
jgi:Cu-Zn family superoxide dismutase